jgi:hypothetical protein
MGIAQQTVILPVNLNEASYCLIDACPVPGPVSPGMVTETPDAEVRIGRNQWRCWETEIIVLRLKT